ncbi:MAG: hypothetical protein GXP15_01350 [Gammaproteobacteria bacterium]|nr:hypothetical protein [Gammaproteobacteria bacterium]
MHKHSVLLKGSENARQKFNANRQQECDVRPGLTDHGRFPVIEYSQVFDAQRPDPPFV